MNICFFLSAAAGSLRCTALPHPCGYLMSSVLAMYASALLEDPCSVWQNMRATWDNV